MGLLGGVYWVDHVGLMRLAEFGGIGLLGRPSCVFFVGLDGSGLLGKGFLACVYSVRLLVQVHGKRLGVHVWWVSSAR